ncbi:MAG: hypothetical protein R2852_09495 [Bacteroidia bacterium]
MKLKYKLSTSVVLITILIGIQACKKKDTDDHTSDATNSPYILEFGNFPPPMIASDNPLTVEGKVGQNVVLRKTLIKR